MRPASNQRQEPLQFVQRGLTGGGVSRKDRHVEGMLGLRILHVDHALDPARPIRAEGLLESVLARGDAKQVPEGCGGGPFLLCSKRRHNLAVCEKTLKI